MLIDGSSLGEKAVEENKAQPPVSSAFERSETTLASLSATLDVRTKSSAAKKYLPPANEVSAG